MRALVWLIGGAAVVALLRGATTQRTYIDASTGLPDVDPARLADDGSELVPDYGPADYSEVSMSDDPQLNRSAFLFALRASEHAATDLPAYDVFYGGSRFMDWSDHPVETGEKHGIPLPPEWCRKAGYADGVCVSTAAGAYQINVPTWREVRDYGGYRLPDFSPDSQDQAALRILHKLGALVLIDRGELTGALALAAKRWASLPGSTAGQHKRTPEFFATAFSEGLNRGMA